MTHTNSNSEQNVDPNDIFGFVRKAYGSLIGSGRALLSGHSVIKGTNNEDGSQTLLVNLAGFKKEEIALSFDESSSVLTVRAEQPEGSTPKFELVVIEAQLDQYVTSEDISSTYVDGLLTVNIADSSGRKHESVANIKIS